MLNLALVALLSGSLLTGSTDDDCKKERTCDKEQTQATVEFSDVERSIIITERSLDDERSIVNDTYAFGRSARSSPIKLWLEYAMGGVDNIYDQSGNELPLPFGAGTGEVNATRLSGGLQFNVVNTSSFAFGVGGEVTVAKDKFESVGGGGASVESSFGLQNVKIFGSVRGRVAGIHGGYILDLADDPTESNPVTTTDMRDAIVVGADFDYPSERYRLFGGVDAYLLQDPDVSTSERGGETPAGADEDDTRIMIATMGAGLRFAVFELGAALIIRAQLDQGLDGFSGGHHGSIAPYLKVSPASLPVSLFVKGAVLSEYTDYGYAIGGGNDIQAGLGFTAGLTVGFE
ncbi:MAG: hypothetical protein R3284_09560 [Rubricoccaceae bacterium]|nr:hypothetical protein [Rubricoccaceae bacterium]